MAIKNKKVVIFGLGDFARVAKAYLDLSPDYEVVAFTVDMGRSSEKELLGVPIVPFNLIVDLYPPKAYSMFVAIGFSKMNDARTAVYRKCKEHGYGLITYISPEAMCHEPFKIGENSFIFENNVIQPFVEIGDNTVLWSGNHIGHDSKIGSNCFVASHAVISGNCIVSDFCFIGVNATFRDGVYVAPRTLVGAGALIMQDTKEGEVYVTQGSRPINKKSWEIDF